MTTQDKEGLDRIYKKFYSKKPTPINRQNLKITKAVSGKKMAKLEEVTPAIEEFRQKVEKEKTATKTGKADLKEIQRRINVPNAGLDYQAKTTDMIAQAKVDMGVATRADLMKQAKEQHIAYFRIMTKAELTEIIKDKAPLIRICEIQEGAKARWKAGWKK